MIKDVHEIRDPIHTFIRLQTDERDLLDTRPLQRLRNIHQLGMTYLIYPGATHRRFEHALGVMHLAGQVFDVLTDKDNIDPSLYETVPELKRKEELTYYRKVVRMAALCHDIGHLPFSHATEGLLPFGKTHEDITADIIQSEELTGLWDKMFGGGIKVLDVVKIAVGPEYSPKTENFTTWESLLTEIIIGDAFGVDRIDYLLRDSHHAGVAYGKFDHHRLIATMRILPKEYEAPSGSYPEPAIGVEQGGLHAAEALLFARYFMWTQVYLHHVRRIYDIHLADFLKEWLSGGFYDDSIDAIIDMNDVGIMDALFQAARDPAKLGYTHAARIVGRNHFRRVYDQYPMDLSIYSDPAGALAAGLQEVFDPELIRQDHYIPKSAASDFPVRHSNGNVVSSSIISEALRNMPELSIDNVFVHESIESEAMRWIDQNKNSVLNAAADAVSEPEKE